MSSNSHNYLDRPEDERFDVDFEFHGVDPTFEAAAVVGRERAALGQRQRDLAVRVFISAQQLAQDGWSVRDIGGALRMTPCRATQLLTTKR